MLKDAENGNVIVITMTSSKKERGRTDRSETAAQWVRARHENQADLGFMSSFSNRPALPRYLNFS